MAAKALNMKLHPADIADVADVLRKGLEGNFKQTKVRVVQCPDLTRSPFYLAAPGLCGDTRIADIGGPPFLIPLSQHRDKIYDFKAIAKEIGLEDCAFMIGAGAGPAHVIGVNSELMPNVFIKRGEENVPEINNKTHYAKVDEMDVRKYSCNRVDSVECCLMCNLFCSRGEGGPVIEVECEERVGEENFITCMRKALASHYGEKPVGMGGVFMLERGRARLHVMPDFSTVPLESEERVNKWLKFYEMSAPLVCLTEFVSHDPGLDLRVEHTHCFSPHGDGGHYHYDVTPTEVKYKAYLNIAQLIYRIDKPQQTHQIGR